MKTHFILKYDLGPTFGRNSYFNVSTPDASAESREGATQFASIGDLLNGYVLRRPFNRSEDQNVQIIRVEEDTPVQTITLLGELEPAPAGATVKYVLQNDIPGNESWFLQAFRSSGRPYTQDLSKALQFDTSGDLTKAVGKAARDEHGGQAAQGQTVRRIAIVEKGVVTETVIA